MYEVTIKDATGATHVIAGSHSTCMHFNAGEIVYAKQVLYRATGEIALGSIHDDGDTILPKGVSIAVVPVHVQELREIAGETKIVLTVDKVTPYSFGPGSRIRPGLDLAISMNYTVNTWDRVQGSPMYRFVLANGYTIFIKEEHMVNVTLTHSQKTVFKLENR